MIGLRLRVTVLLLVGSCLIVTSGASAQCTPEPITVVRGTVFFDIPDEPNIAQGAKVMIQGDYMVASAITDREGKFRFSNLEPGTYTIAATYFGLYAEEKVTVEPGAIVQVVLRLRLPDLKTSPQS